MYAFASGQTGVILRVRMKNSSGVAGTGMTGLSGSSAGLIIATIADNEAAATAYTQAAGHIATITTLGTYAAPAASTCGFKEVDSTNFPGLYEIQLANARFAVAGAKSLIVAWTGVTNLTQDALHIPLQDIDPFNAAALFQDQMTESYPADGVAPTIEQCLLMIKQFNSSFSIVGTALTVHKLDDATTAMGYTLNNASTPTAIVRSS